MTYQLKTQNDLNFYHVSSAFQKCVRRGMEKEALWYGTELFISGYEEYAWFRIMVMCSEDVGLANPNLIVQIHSLHQTYSIFKKKKNKHGPERLPFMNALLLLIRSSKSRIVDNILCEQFFLRESIEQPEYPDFVFDMHTREGKRMGRGNEHFYEESAKIEGIPLELIEEEFEIRDRVRDKYLMQENDV